MLKGKQKNLFSLEIEDLPKIRLWTNDSLIMANMLRAFPVTISDQVRWYRDIVENSSKVVFATLSDFRGLE
jgi:hypothetical protein